MSQLLVVYPALLAVAGFVAATLLSGRALALMSADEKAALVDASSSTRLINMIMIVGFIGLVLWRPLYGWAFLGCAYLAMGVRSFFRLRRLDLPSQAARLMMVGNLCAVSGVVACSAIFVEKLYR